MEFLAYSGVFLLQGGNCFTEASHQCRHYYKKQHQQPVCSNQNVIQLTISSQNTWSRCTQFHTNQHTHSCLNNTRPSLKYKIHYSNVFSIGRTHPACCQSAPGRSIRYRLHKNKKGMPFKKSKKFLLIKERNNPINWFLVQSNSFHRSLVQVNNATAQRIQNLGWFQSKPYSQSQKRYKSKEFASTQICHSLNIHWFRHTMNYSSISPHGISSLQNNLNTSSRQPQQIVIKHTAQAKEFSQKVWSQRHCHITQAENKKHNAKQWHCCLRSPQIFQCFCMCSIVNLTNTQKQSWTLNSVSKHQKGTSNKSKRTSSKQCQSNHTHVCYTTILNKFFKVNLTQCCKRPVNQAKQTKSKYKWSIISASFLEKAKIKTQQTISSQFQQNPSQQYATLSTLFNVSLWQPQMQWYHRNLNLESQKQSPPKHQLFAQIPIFMNQKQKASGTYKTKHYQHTRQHCQTTYQSIQYQKVLLTYFTWTRSSQSNCQKHRQQTTFVQNIETKQIKRSKPSKQTTFKNKQNSYKTFCPISWHIIPTTKNCNWHQNSCKQNHPQTQPIHSKFQTYINSTFPTLGKSYHMAKRFSTNRSIRAPQHHTKNKGPQGKEQLDNSNKFIVVSWYKPTTKLSKYGQKQNIPQQIINRSNKGKHSAQTTTPQYLKPHNLCINKMALINQLTSVELLIRV